MNKKLIVLSIFVVSSIGAFAQNIEKPNREEAKVKENTTSMTGEHTKNSEAVQKSNEEKVVLTKKQPAVAPEEKVNKAKRD